MRIIKNSVSHISVLIMIFIIAVMASLISVSSCTGNKIKTDRLSDEEKISNREVDSLFGVLEYYYDNNPDSAVALALKYEQNFAKSNNFRSLVRLYSYMSEIFQYRKKDDVKALFYILKAMDIMANNPELEFDKTYLYINIGNILYHYDLYYEAIYIYREIQEITTGDLTPKVQTLVYHNIGLSYQASEEFDSAGFYFSKAENEIENVGKERLLLKIQNINYRADLDLTTGNLEMLPKYYSMIEYLYGILDKLFLKFDNVVVKKYQDNSRIDYYSNMISSKLFMSDYYFYNEDNEESLALLSDAVALAKNIDDKYLLTKIYYKLNEVYIYQNDFRTADMYLDSLLLCMDKECPDYEFLSRVYSQKVNITNMSGEKDTAEKYRLLLEKYLDSLDFEQNSIALLHGRIELAFRPVQLAITNIKLSRNEKNRIIYNQKVFIHSLLCLIFIIIISGLVYFRLNMKLNRTRKDLALRTIEKLKKNSDTSNEKNSIKDEVTMEILQKFEEEIVSKKLYRDSDLTLNNVAELLQTNRSYLSKIINTVFEKNFSDYINELRIKESCEIICANTKINFTIDHLYSEVGFTSKSTFYAAFKKYTGVTPAVFFKLNNSGIKISENNKL